MFSYETDDPRASFRVQPRSEAPLTLFFRRDRSTVNVLNIGDGGLAFKNLAFQEGEHLQTLFTIPTEDTMISTTVVILHVDQNDICHCEFRELANEARNAIHRYLLVIQKQELGKKKAMVIPPRAEP